jgi:plastocyanin
MIGGGMMLRGLIAAAVILAVFAAGCGSGKSSTDKTATAVAAPKTVKVQVDGTATDHNEAFFHYFPSALTVHPGDTISFNLHDSGEPHTVSFGSQFSPMFEFLAKNCPNGVSAPPCDQPNPELEGQFNDLFANFPSLLPDGPGDANQGPANPCFKDTGDLPLETACPKTDQPAFNGKQSVFSSGWLGADKDFTVKLADDLQPGTYKFLCLLHGPEMIETVTVVDKTKPADSAADVSKNAQGELDKLTAELKPVADQLSSATADKALAGASSPATSGFLAEFAPKTITIPVGGSVTWSVDGGHTISFNATEDMKSLRKVSSDGTVHANDKAGSPAGLPPPPEQTDPNAPPPLFDGGSWDGSGPLSTGILGGGDFKLTFSKAGTYEYKCLIHDNMEGTVKVGT